MGDKMGLIEYNTFQREYTDVKYKNIEYRLFKNCYFEKAIGKSLNTEYNKIDILEQLIEPNIFVASKDNKGAWRVMFNIGIKGVDITKQSAELDRVIQLIYKIDAKTKIEKLCKHPNGIYLLSRIKGYERDKQRYIDNISVDCRYCYFRGDEVRDVLIAGEFTHNIKLNVPINIIWDSAECEHLYEKHIKVIIPKGCHVRFMLRDGVKILNIEDIGGILGTFPSQILKKRQFKFNCLEYIEHGLHSPLNRESRLLKLEFGDDCKINKIPPNTLKHMCNLEELRINQSIILDSSDLVGLEKLKTIKAEKYSMMIGTKLALYKVGKYSEIKIPIGTIIVEEDACEVDTP